MYLKIDDFAAVLKDSTWYRDDGSGNLGYAILVKKFGSLVIPYCWLKLASFAPLNLVPLRPHA